MSTNAGTGRACSDEIAPCRSWMIAPPSICASSGRLSACSAKYTTARSLRAREQVETLGSGGLGIEPGSDVGLGHDREPIANPS